MGLLRNNAYRQHFMLFSSELLRNSTIGSDLLKCTLIYTMYHISDILRFCNCKNFQA